MAVYTKKGDKGETGLLGGSRIAKDSHKVSCYGTLDEANAALGVARSLVDNEELKEIIHGIQKQIFVVGAELASDDKGKNILKNKVTAEDITKFENIIDDFDKKLGPLHEFIIPGETTASAQLHLARSIVRRAERLIVELNRETPVRQEVIQYVNRLSDTIFMLARAEAHFTMVKKIKTKVLETLEAWNNDSTKLTLELSCKMAEAAEAKAKELGVPIVFSVVDPGGNLVLLHRMEDSLLGSLDISPNKAYTAVALKIATHELVSAIQPGEELYGIQLSNQNKIVTFGGGYPLKAGNEIIGGIGVSGGTVAEDMTIASVALKVFYEERGESN